MAYELGYTAPISASIKTRVSKPVFVAGRINQPQIAEKILEMGQADMCGMTRALISEPRDASQSPVRGSGGYPGLRGLQPSLYRTYAAGLPNLWHSKT